MKKPRNTSVRFIRLAVVACWFTLITSSLAQQLTGHYPAGAEGIKAATLPPPGFYLKDYNLVKFADRLKGADFDATVYVNAIRGIWITDCRILGANYGMDLLVPLVYTDFKLTPGPQHRSFSLGDIHFEPLLLAWHLQQFDFAAGYAFWAPTGDFDNNRPTPPIKDFWSNMLTLGGTWYPDVEKTWAVSALNRLEIHTENDARITAGESYTLEWGLSKSVRKTVDVGVIGYYQQQLTDDSGPGVAYNADIHPRVFGIGPEISMFCPKMGLFVSARYAREFGAVAVPEGNTFTLTLIKRF